MNVSTTSTIENPMAHGIATMTEAITLAIGQHTRTDVTNGRARMRDDTIKRSDAIEALKEREGILQDAYTAVAIIRALPSADRPQGYWIRTGRTNIYGGIEVQCSNCNDKVMVQHLEDEWYCRHCGADMGMKGADDERG